MEPIQLSNCPKTGYIRKVTSYDFLWYREVKQIIIDCLCKFYDTNNKEIANLAGRKKLVASDTLVNPATGIFLTEEQLNHNNTYDQQMVTYNAELSTYNRLFNEYEINHAQWLTLDPETWQGPFEFPAEPQPPVAPVEPAPKFDTIKEYDFYVYVFGANPIILPDVIANLISQRQYRFDELITLV